MTKTKVMLIGALPVGINNYAPVGYPSGGVGPIWRTTYDTLTPTVPEFPQNAIRSTVIGPPYGQFSAGAMSIPTDMAMLAGIGKRKRRAVRSLRGPGDVVVGDSSVPVDESILTVKAPEGSSAREQVEHFIANNPDATFNYLAAMSGVMRLMGATVAGYHGYKRNRKSGWAAAGWATAGFFMPVLTVGVGLVQGLAQPK